MEGQGGDGVGKGGAGPWGGTKARGRRGKRSKGKNKRRQWERGEGRDSRWLWWRPFKYCIINVVFLRLRGLTKKKRKVGSGEILSHRNGSELRSSVSRFKTLCLQFQYPLSSLSGGSREQQALSGGITAPKRAVIVFLSSLFRR